MHIRMYNFLLLTALLDVQWIIMKQSKGGLQSCYDNKLQTFISSFIGKWYKIKHLLAEYLFLDGARECLTYKRLSDESLGKERRLNISLILLLTLGP
jgi:hypothetical protein